MHSPPKSYPNMHIKGGLLRARFLFMVLNHGAERWAQVAARLPEEDRLLLKDIVIDNWYPLAALDRLDRAIAEELGGKEEDVFDRLGEFSATSSLSGPYSSLLNSDIHSFLTQSALIHRSYQDFGSAEYRPAGETGGSLRIKYDIAPPKSFCVSGTAYFRRAVELCGARWAHVTHSQCCGRDDPVCEFFITWKK